jgi:hypothetical protein
MKNLLTVVLLFVSSAALGGSGYTLHLVSIPMGATIYQVGQKKPLGQTPLKIEIPESAFDVKSFALQGIAFEGRWKSGAITHMNSFAGIASTTELIFKLERPLTVPGLDQDKAVEQKRLANPNVASEFQLLVAKANKMRTDIETAVKAKQEQMNKQRELDAIAAAKAAQQTRQEQEAAYAQEIQRQQAAAEKLEAGRRMSNQVMNMSQHLLKNNGRW